MFFVDLLVSFRCTSATLLLCYVLPRPPVLFLCQCSARCRCSTEIAISCVICPGPVVGLCRLRPGRPPGPSSRAGFPLPPRSLRQSPWEVMVAQLCHDSLPSVDRRQFACCLGRRGAGGVCRKLWDPGGVAGLFCCVTPAFLDGVRTASPCDFLLLCAEEARCAAPTSS